MIYEIEKELKKLTTQEDLLMDFRDKYIAEEMSNIRRYINNIYERVEVPYFNNGYHYKDSIDMKSLDSDGARDLRDRIAAYRFCEEKFQEWRNEVNETINGMTLIIHEKKLEVGPLPERGTYSVSKKDEFAAKFSPKKATEISRIRAKIELDQRELKELEDVGKQESVAVYQIILEEIDSKITNWQAELDKISSSEETLPYGSSERTTIMLLKKTFSSKISALKYWKTQYQKRMATASSEVKKADSEPAAMGH